MKFKIVNIVGAAMLLGLTSLSARAEVTEKWTTTGMSHPESVYLNRQQQVLYVSNIVGAPTDKDGNGYIAKLSRGGTVLKQNWVTGLNGPKGMVMDGHILWVSDIDRLVKIDTRNGTVVRFFDAPGAVFLNDTAVDNNGNVYVSDIATRKIWRLKNGRMAVWADTAQHPNGLLVKGDKLVVAGFGFNLDADGNTNPLGNLFTIDLKTKVQQNLGDGRPIGNLDGLESDRMGNYLVTDFNAGKLFRIRPDGSFTELIDLEGGSADLEVIDRGKTAIIPFLLGDKVTAYSID
jgi:SMP-30/Gluconolactonase/LRE-like region